MITIKLTYADLNEVLLEGNIEEFLQETHDDAFGDQIKTVREISKRFISHYNST